VRAQPLTGRLHQIRVHLAAIGFPVVADEFYSPSARLTRRDVTGAADLAPETDDTEPLMSRQALHAHQLRFVHPITRELVSFEAPLPADMRQTIELIRRGAPV
jgi:23S rRNA pseudouridine1911/1915/1917 synthase